jgi:hypothetical protein
MTLDAIAVFDAIVAFVIVLVLPLTLTPVMGVMNTQFCLYNDHEKVGCQG